MQSIGQNGYSDEEVLTVLRGLSGTRELSFRYDLLDTSHTVIRTLDNVLDGSVEYNALSDIKRTAKFTIAEVGEPINYLADRIKPYVRISLPAKEGDYTTSIAAVPNVLARWKFDESGVGPAGDASGNGRTLTIPAGAQMSQAGLVLDGGTSIALTTSQAITGASGYLSGRSVIACVMWIRPSITAEAGVMKTTGVGGTGMSVDIYDNKLVVGITLNGLQNVLLFSKPGVITADETHCVVFTWQSGVGSRLFVDGQDVLDHEISITDAIGDIIRADNLVIGQGASVVSNFAGRVDEFAFFDMYLDPDTAYDLYQAGLQVGRYGALNYAEWPQGVFVLSTPAKDIDSSESVTRAVDAYDLLQVLAEDLLDNRYFVGGAAVYTDAIEELLSNTNAIPESSWDIVSSPKLTPASGYEWAPGTSKLRILNDLLSAINYQSLWFDENGRAQVRPYILPENRLSEFDYSTDSKSVTLPEASYTLDLYKVPNTWVIVVSDPDKPVLRASYVNSDPASPLSTVSRGRTILDFRTEEDAADQFVLDEKVKQIAADAMSIFDEVAFNTAVMPFHSDTDVYDINYPGLGVSGKYNEISWSMPLAAGGVMQHKARKTVVLQ